MTNPNIEIRDVETCDAASVLDYLMELQSEKLDTISRMQIPSLKSEQDWIEGAIDAEHDAIFLAWNNDAVIGMLDVQSGKCPHNRHAGMFGMSVARDWRQRGVGTRLVRAVLERSGSWQDFCRLELNVVPWNTGAISLYEKLGFEHEGRKRKGVNFRGTPEDLLVMSYTWDRDFGNESDTKP